MFHLEANTKIPDVLEKCFGYLKLAPQATIKRKIIHLTMALFAHQIRHKAYTYVPEIRILCHPSNSKSMRYIQLLFLLVPFFFIAHLYGQQNVTGKISDASGNGLPNATVRLKNSHTGVLTDQTGRFQIKVESLEDTLLASFVGFESTELPLEGRSTIQINLKARNVRLNDVLVIGYGTQSRQRVTSAISSVDSSVFEGVPVSNFQYALNGQLPGVVFTQRSGQPGGSTEILVRGASSINASNAPLIVIDGMIVRGSTGIAAGGNETDPFLNLNPQDIASVEVLKDAAAASIYGSRGASGVIIITTKRGKFRQRPTVRLSYKGGISEPSNKYELLNGKEYATLWNRAAGAADVPQASPLYYDVDNQPSTDWWDLITHRGYVQEYIASVSGGSEGTQYYISGNYRDEESYYQGLGLKRLSFRANIDQKINDQVQIGLSLNPSYSVNKRSSDNAFLSPFSLAITYPPNLRAFDDAGALISEPTSIGINFDGSPLMSLQENLDRQSTVHALLNTYVKYSPFPFLTLRTEFAGEFGNSANLRRSSSRILGAIQQNGTGVAQNRQTVSYNWTSLATLSPQLAGAHQTDLSLGTNYVAEERFDQLTIGNNFPNDQLLYLTSASNISFADSEGDRTTFAGYFSRFNYSFSQTYLFTLSARIDGSSRFGEGARYGFFPAASAGWVLSEEAFFPTHVLNFLKLRSSWGISGNAAIGNREGNSGVAYDSYNGVPASVLVELENPNLRWEKNEQWEFGMEFGLWKDRIKGILSYYRKDTKDLLLQVPLPSTSGMREIFKNVGAIRNRGFEYDITVEMLRKPFQWRIRLNGATLQNEVLALSDNNGDGIDDDIVRGETLFRTGEPLDSWYMVPFAGVDPENGDALFLDAMGNKSPQYGQSARMIAGRYLPRFSGGISHQVQYKGFDLSALFQFASGHQILRADMVFLASGFADALNQLSSQLDGWTPDNTETDVPELRLLQQNGNQPSTRFLEDGDYIRLKNLQLGYTFQSTGRWQGRCKIYASGQNLLTFTRFGGIDPEVRGFVSMLSPQARIMSLGVEMGL